LGLLSGRFGSPPKSESDLVVLGKKAIRIRPE
jgi:hypothetical protein